LGYTEDKWSICYANHAGRLWLGPVIHVATATLDSQPIDWALLGDFHMRLRLPGNGKVAAYLVNPLGLGLRNHGSPCPRAIRIGFGYPVASHLAWGTEVSKSPGQPTSFASGIEYIPNGWTAFRTGLRTYPQEYSVGFGLALRSWRLNAACSIHLELGPTYEAGVVYVWQ
jgi:hypothetical protein